MYLNLNKNEIAVLYDTYCHHGGIDVVSGIVGRTASNVEVVGGVCMQ